MATEPPEFTYLERLTIDQLRLLRIRDKGNPEDDIVCELELVSKSAKPTYTALSHCWGDKNQASVPISIVDPNLKTKKKLKIKKTLEETLKYLRKRNDGPWWIDAICINQEDVIEKSAQVSAMNRVYGEAAKVVVFLGPTDITNNSELAIAVVHELGSRLEDLPLLQVVNEPLELPETIMSHGVEKYADALRTLTERPWFRRIWTIQEICMSVADIVMHYGDHEVSFSKFAVLSIHVNFQMQLAKKYNQAVQDRRSGLADPDIDERTQQDGAISEDLITRWKQEALHVVQEPPIALFRQFFVGARKGHRVPMETQCTLLSHLFQFRNRQCTDARDRVYALLSISSDVEKSDEGSADEVIEQSKVPKLKIKADYHKNMDEVYEITTRELVILYNKLTVLAMCHGDLEGSNRPSWAPNFNLRPTYRPFASFTVFTATPAHYQASKGSNADCEFSEEGKVLKVKGYIVDKIQALSGTYAGDDYTVALVDSYCLVQWQSLLGQSQYADVDDAFWRTLIANRNSFSKPATSKQEGREFPIWWKHVFMHPSRVTKKELQTYINYQKAWLQNWVSRNFFVTETGYMGLGPANAKDGDLVCLIGGSQVPLVLRPEAREMKRYQVIGECYVHGRDVHGCGIMDGAMWEELERGQEKGGEDSEQREEGTEKDVFCLF